MQSNNKADSIKGRIPKLELDLAKLRKELIRETPDKELTKIFNCSKPTIQRNIRKNIPTRYHRKNWARNPHNPLNKKIIKLYTNHHYGTDDIGKIIGCSSEKVRKRLILLNIERRRGYVNLNKIHPASFSHTPNYDIPDVKQLNSQIKELYEGNCTLKQVADELGIDRDTVRRRLVFTGIPIRKWTDRNLSRNVAIKEMYLEGKSSYFIAKRFNLSSSQILRALHKLNLQLRKRTKKDYSEDSALCEKIKRLHIDEKRTITEISNESGISWGKAKKHLLASGFKVQRHNNFHKQADFNSTVRNLYVNRQLRMKEVAKELKCCIVKVQKRLRYLGIKPRNAAHYPSEERVRQYRRIIYWYNRGLTIPSVSKMEKIPKSTIYYILERNNVKMDRRKRENHNQKAIVKMALLNRQKYRDYADRKIEKQEERVMAKRNNGMRCGQLESIPSVMAVGCRVQQSLF